MSLMVILVGLVVAVAVVAMAVQTKSKSLIAGGVVTGLLVLVIAFALASVRFVGSDGVGIVTKNALGPGLSGGRIIATEGEMGVQAEVLHPGWHMGYWPIIFDVDTVSLIEIPSGQVGLVESRDGLPLDEGQLFAPEVAPDQFKRMVEDATFFLTEAGGRKGPQSNVLTPGKYRVNTRLFAVEMVASTDVRPATVAVLKSNFGGSPSLERVVVDDAEPVLLAKPGEKGVRAAPLPPGKYPVNTSAFSVSSVSTSETIVRFTAASAGGDGEQREINVRTSDGFTFPVDVRIEYRIDPENAPVVVAKLGSDGQPLLAKLNSTVRAIFRNNAESVKALDYVNQRSQQESQSLAMIGAEMAQVGVTISGVRIGDVGDVASLGELLKTQTDREIALQEQVTFQEQQRAAEQEKELTRTQQEAEEERRLATARYEVQIAEQAQQQRIIQAEAEAEAIRIEAEARAKAYELVAGQIGPGNAALVELLRVVGENQINITPRVMVSGAAGGVNQAPGVQAAGPASPETVALIGTMLDTMIDRTPEPQRRTTAASTTTSGDGS